MKNILLKTTLAIALLPPMSYAAANDKPWSFDASLNLFLAGMSGDVKAKGAPAHVNASFAQIFDHLEAGAAGRFTLGYLEWFVSTEFSYLKLSTRTSTADAELDQWLLEPSVGYEICEYAALHAGARYNSISGHISFSGPSGRVATGAQDWWDPIIGATVGFPLFKDRLRLNGRFDVGGFGLASDLTWQAYPHLNWHFTEWGSAQIGYRWLATDYENGSDNFEYDVLLQGPQVGLTAHF